MKNYIYLASLPLLILTAPGCSGPFWGGAAGGVVGTGAGYEYNAHNELEKVEEDYKAGRINEDEYNARKDQIKRMSILK